MDDLCLNMLPSPRELSRINCLPIALICIDYHAWQTRRSYSLIPWESHLNGILGSALIESACYLAEIFNDPDALVRGWLKNRSAVDIPRNLNLNRDT